MAIAVSSPVALAVTTSNTDTHATSAYTPSANSIQVAFIFLRGSVGTDLAFADSEGGWTQEGSIELWAPGDDSNSCAVYWRKVGGSPVSITPTATTTDAFTAAAIAILEFIPDTVVSGNPIRQVAHADSAGSANPVATFASNRVTTNGYGAAICFNQNSTTWYTAPTDWTEVGEAAVGTPGTGLWNGFRAGGETGTTVTVTGASAIFAMFAVEVLNDEEATGFQGRRIGRAGASRSLVNGGLAG